MLTMKAKSSKTMITMLGMAVVALAGCDPGTVCDDAANHLAACGVTDVVLPESCSLGAVEVANEILASECDALTTRGAQWFQQGWGKPKRRYIAQYVCDYWEDGKVYYSSHYVNLNAWSPEEARKAYDSLLRNAPPGCSYGPIRWV